MLLIDTPHDMTSIRQDYLNRTIKEKNVEYYIVILVNQLPLTLTNMSASEQLQYS